MGDEIKVTVIATGFDKAESRRGADRADKADKLPIVTKDAQDIPTIIRNRWEQERTVRGRSADAMADEYDIPAFLRRRVE